MWKFIKICVVISLIISCAQASETEDAGVLIELVELDYEDQCATQATTYKAFLTSDLSDWFNLYFLTGNKIVGDKEYARLVQYS